MIQMESERAQIFWEDVDVDSVFDELLDLLHHLREAIRTNTATDKEYVQAMKIILDSELTVERADTIEEVLIDEDILTVTVSESQSPDRLRNGVGTEEVLQKDSSRNSKDEWSSDYSQMSSAGRPEAVCSYDPSALLSPLSFCSEEPKSPATLLYQPHDCSPACVPRLPAHADRFLGHNPLRVPMLCQFQRQCARIRVSAELNDHPSECQDGDVLYKAPCGRSLRSTEDVLHFLLQSNSLGILQPDNFTFNPQIVPDHQALSHALAGVAPAVLMERDLSRGIEPVPIALFNDVDGLRPKEFRYRKDRWPHGCFLSAAPFFSACCDCTDGCADVQTCACLQLTLKADAHSYKHLRLNEAVRTGLFECGPWCGCEKSRCQNRVVQRGLRVRLQVFRTVDRGWAVRCRDDLDKGTFVCIYAGVVLRLEQNVEEPAAPKSRELVSDDEVEVVEEWTLPSGVKETVTETLDRSPPLYVPVIQRPADQPAQSLETDGPHASHKDQQLLTVTLPDCSETEPCEEVSRKKPRLTESNGLNDGTEKTTDTLNKLSQICGDDVYYLDASKEGNVARFINHSCDPNLFIQNVFTDTHNKKFPIAAFFTNRMIKAGTELTWNYSYKAGSEPDHELPCRCGNRNCQEVLI
ncbi:histone-lysine N-methyltransferase SETDB2 [Xyrauchen texanus]|uniref:histone-lysine N-methyltransferase SETDB2 n=1 Tax=Xyrauchen texanus TaxID=154827 RepID=UPI0022423BA0|nr:histone-lysine N-methyltransferase SETDB2 [Xyrauchen texanus]XP_051982398.1 histone-lysine N-methyltransferase SETDB2 [Xyrauchen texanus]XP_051982399.1 histone-lysine N-methyltransferase SETDB2 [Xyrauchen texanus]